MIGCHPVLKSMGPSSILGNITANRRYHLAGRIRGIIKVFLLGCLRHVQIHYPGLDHSQAIFIVDAEDPIHPRKFQNDSAFDRNRPSA